MFASIDALCQEFALDGSKTHEELISELARRRAAIHPDKNNGTFLSQAAESQYQRLSEALDYLRGSGQTQLALTTPPELHELSKLVASIQSTVEQLRLDKSATNESEAMLKRQVSRSYLSFRLASGTFATACAAILSFSEKMPKNPILAPLASSPTAKWVILMLFVLTGLAFMTSWINEHRLKSLMDFLLSDRGLCSVMYWCLRAGKNENPKTEITQQQIVHEILEIGDPWHKSKILRFLKRLTRIRVSHEFADQVAAIQLSTLTARGVVTREGFRGIAPRFIIEQSRAEDIFEDFQGPYSPRFW